MVNIIKFYSKIDGIAEENPFITVLKSGPGGSRVVPLSPVAGVAQIFRGGLSVLRLQGRSVEPVRYRSM
jgi:hypothetical protein